MGIVKTSPTISCFEVMAQGPSGSEIALVAHLVSDVGQKTVQTALVGRPTLQANKILLETIERRSVVKC